MAASIIDIGEGPAVVLIPGIHGRWEWMAPTARTLATRCRVITFSLPGEPGSGCAHDPSAGFDLFVAQIDDALDAAGLEQAAVCGISFGGLVALLYAARRPERTSALGLVSAPGPRWQPDTRARRYMAAPARSVPAFVIGAPGRMYPEIAAALSGFGPRLRFAARHLGRVVAAPMSPTRMADRLRLVDPAAITAACARVMAPTLVVTGEPRLDRVVPVESTREYGTAIRGAVVTEFSHTGHLGLVTRPREFAALVGGFVAEHAGRSCTGGTPPAEGHREGVTT